MRNNLNFSSKQLPLVDIAEMFLKEEKLRVRKDIRASTFRTYEIRNQNLIEYLQKTNQTAISIDEINIKFLDQLKKYLLYNRCVSQDHARRVMAQLKQIVNFAHLYELTDKNTIQGYKLRRSRTRELVYLTEQELDRLMHFSISTPMLRRVADLFKVQCWTGLAYGDLERFSIQNVERDADRYWITYRRKKTGISEAILPLLPEAEEILKKYHFQLPLLQNGKYNRLLKELADLLGFQKKLTSHVGRKTFGMIMLNRGITIEVVSKMLGHASIRTTQEVYAKVLKERVAKDINNYLPIQTKPSKGCKLIILR